MATKYILWNVTQQTTVDSSGKVLIFSGKQNEFSPVEAVDWFLARRGNGPLAPMFPKYADKFVNDVLQAIEVQ